MLERQSMRSLACLRDRSPFCFPGWSAASRRRCWDGALAVVLFFCAQFLICGLQRATAGIDFPAPIMAMVAVGLAMLLADTVVKGLDVFYQTHLRRPVRSRSDTRRR